MNRRLATRVAVAALALAGLAGCGTSGPARQELEGEVTFGGRLVPHGSVRFDPVDAATGVQGSATIRNGRYRTNRNFGPPPGRYVAVVDGAGGKPAGIADQPLFTEARVEVNIPAGVRVLDLHVPAAEGAAR